MGGAAWRGGRCATRARSCSPNRCRTDRLGLKPARIIERLGAMGDARSVSLIAIHTHDIPQEFPPAALRRGRTRTRHAAWPARPTCATSRWSPSTARTRATSTMRCIAEPDGDGLPPDRRDRRRRALRPPGVGARPCGARRAATASTSRTASCRCCPRRCRTAGAACGRTRTAAACSSNSVSTRHGRKTAHRFGRGLMRSAARLTYDGVQRGTRRRRCRPIRASAMRRSAPCWPRAHGARHARSRPAGAPGRARRRWRGAQRRAAAASRQPPADRGIHGPGQCRRRRGTGAAAPACDVPRPRPALGRKACIAARASCTGSASRCRPATGASARSGPCAAPRRRHAGSAAGQRGDAAQPVAGRVQSPTISAISASPCRAMRISPARSAAMPICWCIAR